MNVALTKEIALKSAIIYLKLQKQIERKDIQSYLQGKRFNNPIVESRVREYLKSIRIYDEQYNSTPYGSEVKETGMVDVMEEGEYKIYFTQDDSYFYNTIFFFQRQCPQFNQQPNFKSISFNNKVEHFCLSPIKDKPFRFFLKESNPGIEMPSTTSITFFWKWKELESSVYTFKGKIENNVIDDKAEFKIDEDLHKCITAILPDWDSANARYKIPFGSISDSDSASFECSYDNKHGDFKVHIDKLPIEPYNRDDAQLWRNHLLDVKLSEDYLNSKDFGSVVRDINQSKGFIAYKVSLDVPTAEEYLKEISQKAGLKRVAAYWHLAAPLDLNPGIPKAMIKQIFSYPVGQTISFQEIAQNIHRNNVEKIFYYDKYVITQKQQEYLCAFFEAFSPNKAYLITDTTKKDRRDYIEKQHNNILQKNMNDIFKNNKSQHDRYLILSVGVELKVWNVSNSFDYIQFDENNVSADAIGTIKQSVIFTNVEEKMLFPELLQFIKEEIKNA